MTADAGFLRMLRARPGDRIALAVYADWLEEHGDLRGEFIRLYLQFADTSKSPKTVKAESAIRTRLQEMRTHFDAGWIALIDQTLVELCPVEFLFECPKRWEKLHVTDDPLVRYCDTCQKTVHFCRSIRKARSHARQGDCVAVESTLARQHGDLDIEKMPIILGMVLEPPLYFEEEPEEPAAPP